MRDSEQITMNRTQIFSIPEAGIASAGMGRYYLMPASCTFLQENANNRVYPYSQPPASRTYRYSADCCPNARNFLETTVRWVTFCEKYQPEHCELAAVGSSM